VTRTRYCFLGIAAFLSPRAGEGLGGPDPT
jgi:hypothetical protein